MFDNLNIGKKMLLLSGTILCLLLVVLAVGLYGLSKTVKSGKEVAQGAELKGLIDELEIAHLNWDRQVSTHFIDKSINELNVETDYRKCGFGQWYYGEGRQHAEQMMPELRNILQEIEEPHTRLHAAAKKIKDIYRAADGEQPASAAAEAEKLLKTEIQPNLEKIVQLFDKLNHKISVREKALVAENATIVKNQTTTVISIGILSLFLGIIIAIIISRSLTKPLNQAVILLDDMRKGRVGNRFNLQRKDQIGQMADAIDDIANFFQRELLVALQKLADGDLTFEITPVDEQDEVRGTIKKLGDDLNDIMGQIQIAGNEISSASGEIADSSQSLSQGATESAASLEEISASLNQTSSQTTLNAENATQANSLSTATKLAAEKGRAQMQEMVAAMTEINEEGQKISKIIKTIDEIAFQTNLLALNAAVEAARAGQHGKGFAVVAEEVRNLAARSAKAAAETSELIEGSAEKTATGSVIAKQTAEALEEIVSGIGKVTDLVAEIAAASNEQAQGVAEINVGVTQIDTVTQQNTASAEESAAAAEELSAQAAQLHHMLQRFKLKQQGIAPAVTQIDNFSSQRTQSANSGWGGVEESLKDVPIKLAANIALDDGEYGKY